LKLSYLDSLNYSNLEYSFSHNNNNDPRIGENKSSNPQLHQVPMSHKQNKDQKL